MNKYVVTWTFMRHVHRHREYKILTRVFEAEDRGVADFKMLNDPEAKRLYSNMFRSKLKSITEIKNNEEQKMSKNTNYWWIVAILFRLTKGTEQVDVLLSSAEIAIDEKSALKSVLREDNSINLIASGYHVETHHVTKTDFEVK